MAKDSSAAHAGSTSAGPSESNLSDLDSGGSWIAKEADLASKDAP